MSYRVGRKIFLDILQWSSKQTTTELLIAEAAISCNREKKLHHYLDILNLYSRMGTRKNSVGSQVIMEVISKSPRPQGYKCIDDPSGAEQEQRGQGRKFRLHRFQRRQEPESNPECGSLLENLSKFGKLIPSSQPPLLCFHLKLWLKPVPVISCWFWEALLTEISKAPSTGWEVQQWARRMSI